MSQFPYQQSKPFDLNYATDEKSVFNFFNAVYAWMCVGLAVTAAVAYIVSMNVQVVVAMNAKGITIALFLGLAVLSYGIQAAAHKIGAGAATALFILYAAILGAALSYIFIIYKMSTIGAAFAITGGTFGVMSVLGYVTKRDLTRLGGMLTMAAIGLFIASLVNIFMQSSGLSWIITYAVVIVFTGLVAYHTQSLREIAVANSGNPRALASHAIVGSLILYVDFINIFVSILRILGSRK
ncbi:Bax inhibitor-1/YccA family protein [Humisphaera borealis]|uniref:Bax inhibitor-1/YccA family protein n=1 Tax=Humisphaera borealis TaxID=2807512 RepID=A0A7M2X1E3_9BACT|nr:Bax inhibitor-1/YccA family protein [Humisphaera borealis]QOV91505.1 Bax inhibitor-1/YccA family protein [Humisphaera borealis]